MSGREAVTGERRRPDWNPDSGDAMRDQIAVYDAMRRRCPVAYSEHLHWCVFRHADAMRMLTDPDTFSNAVSAHLSVPNGLDPPVHGEYRRMLEPYFAEERIAALEPRCRAIAVDLISQAPADGALELMDACAEPFALQSQCAFLDWPAELHAPLREWVQKNQRATRNRDRTAMADVAMEFDHHIRAVLADRRRAGDDAATDVAARLLREQVRGRLLTDEEIVSILRNWTVGELATISASIGILVHYLAERPSVQSELREERSLLPAAIDEILRIQAPLIASRRKAAATVEIGGRRIDAGERVTLIWAAANRDERVFGDPDEFRLDRDPARNLLYGAGIHVCPGAPLARMELRVFMEELLRRTSRITLVAEAEPIRATYPASGFSTLPLRIHKTSQSARQRSVALSAAE
jgi:cytochrome P450